MTIPSWMWKAAAGGGESTDAPPPGVIDQRPGPNGVVYVTFSLPGLRRAVVAVPESAWLNGEHLAAGPMSAALFDSLGAEPGSNEVELPPDLA